MLSARAMLEWMELEQLEEEPAGAANEREAYLGLARGIRFTRLSAFLRCLSRRADPPCGSVMQSVGWRTAL